MRAAYVQNASKSDLMHASATIRPTLERGKLSQALLDICAVLVALLLVLVTGIGIVALFFILFFVST